MSEVKPYRLSKINLSRKKTFSSASTASSTRKQSPRHRFSSRSSRINHNPSSSTQKKSPSRDRNSMNNIFRIEYTLKNSSLNTEEISMIPSKVFRLMQTEKRVMKGMKKTEFVNLPFSILKGLKKGNGGYAGIIPWYMEPTLENGKETKEFKMILNTSVKHNGLLSYIGGGIKKGEKPIEGIYREIHEETPQWEEYLIHLLKNNKHPKFILMSDTYYPHSKKETRSQIRYSILIFLQVDPDYLLNSFVPSSEVAHLNVMTVPELLSYRPPPSYQSLYRGAENGLSSGINDLRKMILTTHLFIYFFVHIKHILSSDDFEQFKDSFIGKTEHDSNQFYKLSNFDQR